MTQSWQRNSKCLLDPHLLHSLLGGLHLCAGTCLWSDVLGDLVMHARCTNTVAGHKQGKPLLLSWTL